MNNTKDWGLTSYEDAYARQLECVEKRKSGLIEDTLIFTEHKPVFTIGKRKESQDNLVWSGQERTEKGIVLAKTNRGGDVTCHNPGQIVGYSIIDLASKQDLHLYLRNLEQVIINALGALGLAASRRDGLTGIWIKERKIAAMGIAVSRWVTYHGFALNVNNDLSIFSGIVPCGIASNVGSVTSLSKELGIKYDLNEVKSVISVEFWKIFAKVHA